MVDGWCMYSRGNLRDNVSVVEYKIMSMLPLLDGWMIIVDAIVLYTHVASTINWGEW